MKHVLDLPWGDDALKEKYGLKTIKGGYSLYSGVLLPRDLRPFRSEDFSFTRWSEDESNAHVSVPDKAGKSFTPTEQQLDAGRQILETYQKGSPGFLLATPRGSGKKLAALNGVAMIAKQQGYKPWDEGTNKAKLLIVTSKTAIPTWRETLKRYPVATALTRPLIVSHNQLSKLLMAPPSARLSAKRSTKSKLTSRNGVPTIDWDFIIFDEAHFLKNYPKNPHSASAAAVAKLNRKYSKEDSPFVIFSTATPGKSPLDFSLQSKLLSPGFPRGGEVFPKDWVSFLVERGFSLGDTSRGKVWLGEPPSRGPLAKQSPATTAAIVTKDTGKLARALKAAPGILGGSGKSTGVKHIPLPVELKGSHKLAYSNIWGDFQKWLNRNLMNSDPEGYAQQSARYSWRANSLKKEYIFDIVLDVLEGGSQVYLKVPTLDAVAYYHEKLADKKVVSATLTAHNEDDAEAALELFKSGVARVLIVTDFLTDEEYSLGVSPVVVLTDVTMIPSFYFERERFFADRGLVVYLPYLEKTLEEHLLGLFVDVGENKARVTASPLLVEKLFRTTAARNIPPNRMS